MLKDVLEQITADAEALRCVDEVQRCCDIVAAGSSADSQLAVFLESTTEQEGVDAALRWIAQASLA
jgi:gamma-glutamyl:cysteine ligase YbdK (ATP-grasp superfamily)